MSCSNRNSNRIHHSTNTYVHDAWKARYCPQRSPPRKEIKCSSYLVGSNHQSGFLDSRTRSPSPNLPRIPYLHRGNQRYYPSPPRYTSSRRSKGRQQSVSRDVSRKTIPEHVLMKSLLNGLENFTSKAAQVRPKSMGNITTPPPNHFPADPLTIRKPPRSQVDFSKAPPIEFKPFFQKRVDDDHDDDEVYKSETSCIECIKERRTQLVQKCTCCPECLKLQARRRRPNNLVAQRKQFFENQIKPPLKSGEEVTEIYRNFKSVFSTSTLSKRSSSVPPCVLKTLPKNSDLFNPDYNFNYCSRKSLIESIRSKIFHSNSDCEGWGSCKLPKFPRETRRAMSIILSNGNSNLSCRICQRKLNAGEVADVETQTTPVASQLKFGQDSSRIPCTKNLLCNRGLHAGQCEENLKQKLRVVCAEDCVCRNRRRFIPYEQLNFPSRKSNKEEKASEESLLGILKCDLEVEGHSRTDDSRCESYLGDEHLVFTPRKLYQTGRCRPKSQSSSEDSLLEILRGDHEIEGGRPKASDEGHSRGGSECGGGVRASSSDSSFTMNGLNGHSNGDLNGCGDIITQNQQRGCWTIGLINSKYRYLTAETFGFKINANGTSLKKKQIWTLEPDNSSGSESLIYLKSHLDKYLAVDSFGNVTCESEEKDPGSKFQISVAEDGTGRWAFRNVVRGYFLGSSSDKLTCTAKVPGDAEFWHIHLAARPQVNLRSVGRKRFAHLSENLDEIHVDANIPWGEDTLFTLEFHADESGKYALHTCNNKYLSNGGKLVDSCSKDCLFSAEYHSGQLALRDRNGAYLSPIGSKAVLKTRSNTVTKDELFSLEDSLPQASFVAALNSRYVSVKQGVDVTANQDEISDHETFQLEFDWSTKRWYIRTMQDKYWTLETGGGIQASGDKRSSNALFDLVWQTDGALAFRANNGRYVMTKRSGHLYATSDVIDDNCKYYFYLVNRPILVLKCEQGFVGYKSASSPKLECNKATYECIQVERAEKGVIYFKGQNGKYWHFDSEGVTADSDAPEGFYLELREPTRLCIKTASGNYLTAGKNGVFRIGDSSIENATQWEY